MRRPKKRGPNVRIDARGHHAAAQCDGLRQPIRGGDTMPRKGPAKLVKAIEASLAANGATDLLHGSSGLLWRHDPLHGLPHLIPAPPCPAVPAPDSLTAS